MASGQLAPKFEQEDFSPQIMARKAIGPLKVAIVLPPRFSFSAETPNSIETVVRTLAGNSLYRDSIRVVCDASNENTGDIATIPVDPSGSRRARTRRVIHALRAWNPDIIELHQHAPTASMVANALRDRPCYFYRHNFLKPPKTMFQRLRYTNRYKVFDAHVFVSEFSRRQFSASYPTMAQYAYAVPNAIDFPEWAADPGRREPVIAYVGRAAPEKGFAELCAALHVALDGHADWRAELVTNEWQAHAGWAEATLEPLRKFGARISVRQNQHRRHVRKVLQRAAIAVVPSNCDEGFGLAAIEAHAAGAAVISSGRGGLREASGSHAFYLDAVTPDTIARALETLMRDKDRRLALASAGQAYVAETHGAVRRAAQLDELRDSLVLSAGRNGV